MQSLPYLNHTRFKTKYNQLRNVSLHLDTEYFLHTEQMIDPPTRLLWKNPAQIHCDVTSKLLFISYIY